MKLERLLLTAFGPFTDVELDLSAGADLHLIYGPNEVGKSSALRAMLDLRFGIPLRSGDGFVHAYADMRVGGVFVDGSGERVGLVRRKGRGQTLAAFDPAAGHAGADLPVAPAHERALTGGLERCEFEHMFGIDHERLRAGGDLLLQGDGEVGSALFAASAGTRGIGALLDALDNDAKRLFNPHGRAQNAVVNAARATLEEQRTRLREAQVRPVEWRELERAHEDAQAARAEIGAELERLRRHEKELTELRSVEPLLKRRDAAAAALRALEKVPDLAENAREQRLAAEQALAAAQAELHEADLELERTTRALGGIGVDECVLEHADAIERFVAGIEHAARSRLEIRREQAAIDELRSELALQAARIARGAASCDAALERVLEAVPADAERAALTAHLEAAARLSDRLTDYREQRERLERDAAVEGEEAAVPDGQAREALGRALEHARQLGDVEGDLLARGRDIAQLERALQQALADLGAESAGALRAARPLLEAEIASHREALGDIETTLRRLHDEDAGLAADLEAVALEQGQLAALGEVVTADTLNAARARRDEAWRRVREIHIDGRRDSADDAREIGAAQPPAEAFESAQAEADRQADLLRADAKRAAEYEQCARRIQRMQARRADLAAEVAALEVRREGAEQRWAGRLREAGLPALAAEALEEWQRRRAQALELDDRLDRDRGEADRLRERAGAAARALAEALQAFGCDPVAGTETACRESARGLAPLIDAARDLERRATQAEAANDARLENANRRRAELADVVATIEACESRLRDETAALEAWHARLMLPAGSAPAVVKERLAELDALARRAAQLREATLRQAQHRAVVDDLAARAQGLAERLGEPLVEASEAYADCLRRRLADAREHDQQRKGLLRDRQRADERKRRALADREGQLEACARLCEAAGVADVAELPEAEEAAARKREARRALDALSQQLAEVSARSEADLRAALAELDQALIDAERERCAAGIARLEDELGAARERESEALRRLETVDSSDEAAAAREALESAAARYAGAIRPWGRLRLAHALLREASNRFRERAQAPMLAAASEHFALMTRGRYERLLADASETPTRLRAQRTGGDRIGVEAMSEGTRDQLYLALRLAALELRRTEDDPMPLVLDDVLVTSDDARAAAALEALARFASGGRDGTQVLLFTHHEHLIDIARDALGEDGVAVHRLGA